MGEREIRMGRRKESKERGREGGQAHIKNLCDW